MRKWKRAFARCDDWLDNRPAVRHLKDDRLAAKVVESLTYFAGQRYALWAYVVMPSHFHWVFEPACEWIEGLGSKADDRSPRQRIMHSVKMYSARWCNKLLGRKGAFWQDESYDHCIRDLDELERAIDYVELNPVKAGLANAPEAWTHSSARYRADRGIDFGMPIIAAISDLA